MAKVLDSRITAAVILIAAMLSCSGREVPVLRVVDWETRKMVELTGERTKPVNFYDADFVILGGGLGGIAAALSICSSGRTALLVEESDRIAGCFSYRDTTQYSESDFVETSGTSLSYQTFRRMIREWYEEKSAAPPVLFSELYADIPDFGSDNFCFETEAALDVINDMLESNIEKGKLSIIKRHKVAKIVTFNNRIASLLAVDLDNLVTNQITGWMFVDATRTGYILPILGLEHTSGRESREETGEPHAFETADSLMTDTFMFCPVNRPTGDSEKLLECYVADLDSQAPQGPGGYLSFPFGDVSRRIEAYTRIREQDISASSNEGPRARFFKDSVGIGYYPITIPSDTPGTGPTVVETKPFQIPLSALVPVGYTNLLSGGRTLGATYVASTAYMAPSVEWTIGEAAGEAAAYCAGYKIYTHELVESPIHVRGLQDWLVTKRSVPIYWYDDVHPGDEDFSVAQLKPFDEPDFFQRQTTLHYHDGPAD